MLKEIDNYINQATSDIKYGKARRTVRLELKEHILTSVDHYQRDYPEVIAIQMAIEDMGNPHEVVKEFNDIYPSRNIFIYRLLVFTLLILSFSLYRSYDNYFKFYVDSIKHDPFKDISQLSYTLNAKETKIIDTTYVTGNIQYNATHAFLLPDDNLGILIKRESVNNFDLGGSTYYLSDCSSTCAMIQRLPTNKELGNLSLVLRPDTRLIVLRDYNSFPDSVQVNYATYSDQQVRRSFTIEIGE